MASDDYDVGRGKPPASKKFSKGSSGNLKGRPPRPRKAIWEIIDYHLMQKREVIENGTARKRAHYALILRQLDIQWLAKPTKRLERIEAKYEAIARSYPIRRKKRAKDK